MGISCMSQESQTGALYHRLEGGNGEGDGREVQKRGDTCIPMADSCWGLTEQQNSVKQLSFNERINKLK